MDSERRELENSEDECIVCRCVALYVALCECAAKPQTIYMCVPEDTGAADPKGLVALQHN